jgi:hypothetical protein
MLAWAMFRADDVQVNGNPSVYHSPETGRRSFCGTCGTGLFFTNNQLAKMGMKQIRIAALNEPDAIAPKMQVQTAERPKWVESAYALPAFDHFPV